MIDDIRVRKGPPAGGEPRSAPPVPRQLMDKINSAPSGVSAKPVRSIEILSEPKSQDVPAPEEPAEELPGETPEAFPPQPGRPKSGSVFAKYWRWRVWTLPLTILLIACAVMAVPVTRYKMLAYFVSRPLTVTVTDSTTNTPVSGAVVKLDGAASTTTDSSGHTSISVPVGDHRLTVTKTYYQTLSRTIFVDLNPAQNDLSLQLAATGRQVPLEVINKITGKPIPEAELTIDGTTARSDLKGRATVVLPTDSVTQPATIKADGYYDLTANVTVTGKVVDANTFAMVPKGRIFFLSNQNGNIDIISTNLDGSGRKTALDGTGSEVDNTVLLASRDWKYLALLSRRNGGSYDQIFLFNTASGRLTTIDDSSGTFTLIGWSDHDFTYQVTSSETQSWQPGKVQIMSYDADKGQSNILAKNKATGTSDADAQYQTFDQATLLGSNVIYAATWHDHTGDLSVPGQTNTLASVKADGTGSRTLKSVAADQYYASTITLANPTQLYFGVYNIGSSGANYYRLDLSGNLTQSSAITSSSVNQNYPIYLLSPSGTATLWTKVRDGQNALFVGDSSGANGDQVALLSGYLPYGWFGDGYLLLQKNGSELYIMPAGGGKPLKISDYYKPDYVFYGYGGSYGGL